MASYFPSLCLSLLFREDRFGPLYIRAFPSSYGWHVTRRAYRRMLCWLFLQAVLPSGPGWPQTHRCLSPWGLMACSTVSAGAKGVRYHTHVCFTDRPFTVSLRLAFNTGFLIELRHQDMNWLAMKACVTTWHGLSLARGNGRAGLSTLSEQSFWVFITLTGSFNRVRFQRRSDTKLPEQPFLCSSRSLIHTDTAIS